MKFCDAITSLLRVVPPKRGGEGVYGYYIVAVYSACVLLILSCYKLGIPQLQSAWSLSCDHGLDYAS